MKKILIPTDFSECAHNAQDYAISLFGTENIQYRLLNTFREPSAGADMLVAIIDILKEDSRKGLEEEKQRLMESNSDKGVDIDTISEYGQLSHVIEKEVQSEEYDYVVMGTTGAEGIKKFFSGSNASDVINDAKCPLLIVPNNYNFTSPVRMGLATDFKEEITDELLEPVKEIAERYKSAIRVINIEDNGDVNEFKKEELKALLSKEFQNIPHLFYTEEYDDKIKGINDFVDNYGIDILTLITRHRGFFENLFHSSVSKKIAMQANIPLLILNRD